MAILAAQTFTLTAGGTRLSVLDDRMTVRMDEGNSPWLTAEATIRRPADAVMALLEPDRRTAITLTLAAPASLAMTFTVQGREFTPDSDTVALTLVSDEYPLLTYAPSTVVDLRAKTYQASARAIAARVVTLALGKATAVALAAGTADKSFTTYSAVEDLFPDPNVTTIANWAAASLPTGRAALSQDTSLGKNAARAQSTGGSGVSYVQVVNSVVVPATAGQQYTGSVLPQSTSTGNDATGSLIIAFRNAAGSNIQTYSKSLGVLPTLFTNSARVGITAVAPAGTASVHLYLRAASTANLYTVSGAEWMIVEGDGLDTDGTSWITWFQGDTVPGSTGYTYGWTGAANASTSTRTPVTDRDPESLRWLQTDRADDFLRPILEAVGLRLFQNERGAFILADNGYKLAGQVVMQQGSTLYGAVESSSVLDDGDDGFPLNADAVIVTYAWTDAFGVARTATDFAKAATTYSRPYLLEKRDTPYPGPGQAKFLLARLLARKRQIDTTGRPDWTARPGMSAVVSLPHRPTATGYVQALVFDLAAATMTVTTKGLVTTPPGSIGNAPITQTIGSVSGNIAAYTN
ncbi:hypothetical protein EDF51_11124 [Curtobacterium sp. PhB25]|uniref:hypothetical protein n=1 Tax=Curtobacterium sp. PhB25 TaxID=2485205 RepID=UPI001064C3F4|nr:hypothetical protein [Curtobacterium sp. PhB25]TDW64754.1 hypothetical protein EDF51_11124 [Curtobacterium sp. PhB25]